MPTVEKVSGGRVLVRGIGRFEVGDQAEVSESEADYLVNERGDFVRVDSEAESGVSADSDTKTSNGSEDEETYTCAGSKADGDPCTRTVEAEGGRCYQHQEENG